MYWYHGEKFDVGHSWDLNKDLYQKHITDFPLHVCSKLSWGLLTDQTESWKLLCPNMEGLSCSLRGSRFYTSASTEWKRKLPVHFRTLFSSVDKTIRYFTPWTSKQMSCFSQNSSKPYPLGEEHVHIEDIMRYPFSPSPPPPPQWSPFPGSWKRRKTRRGLFLG